MRLQTDFHVCAVVAGEIEFYLRDMNEAGIAAFSQALSTSSIRNELQAGELQKERGAGQYELALTPDRDAARAAQAVLDLRLLVMQLANEQGGRADFSAKPYDVEPGSGLHFHLHLERDGKNLFSRDGENYSAPLRHSIAGLLTVMKEGMVFYAPSKASYARFIEGCDAPTTRSWGPNNRTVAIRLPTKPMDRKHLEHRVAGADADPFQVMAVMLAGIHYGLGRALEPPAAIFGNAGLAQYGQEKLPADWHGAAEALRTGHILKHYFGEERCAAQLMRFASA